MSELSFFDIVANSGFVGIMVWLWIFVLTFAGIGTGTFAILGGMDVKENRYPLPLKILFYLSIATLMAGAQGTITGYVDSFAMLGTTTGAAKAAAMELCLSQSRTSLKFALGAVALQIIFEIITLCYIEARAKKLSIEGLSFRERLRNIPITVLIAIPFAILAILGASHTLGLVEQILQLKPGETIPEVMGMNYAVFLKTIGYSSLISIVLMCISPFGRRAN